MSIIAALGRAALRHYRDPLSWTACVAAVAAAAHLTLDPAILTQIDVILASLASILLAAADGRKNPNTAPDGAIPPRVQDGAPDAPGVAPDPHNDLQAVDRSAVRPARRIGPDHGNGPGVS